jgi:hypothetical protein
MGPFFFHGKGFSIIHYGLSKLKQKKPSLYGFCYCLGEQSLRKKTIQP